MSHVPVAGARVPPPYRSAWARALVACGLVIVIVTIVLDLLTGPNTTFSPLLASLPVLTSAATRRAWLPILTGGTAMTMTGLLALFNPGVPLSVHITAMAAVFAVTLGSTATVLLVSSRERELLQVRGVAEAAQWALLRAVPAQIGPVRLAVRYLAAAAEARIGGDLYEVLPTPYGIRLLIGDVRGKGLPAVETAVDVLGAFREAARTEPSLAAVASRLDTALARRGTSEDFVTAVLANLPDDSCPAEIVNCGHPAPLLIRSGRVTELEPSAWAPPLGLLGLVGSAYPTRTFRLVRGDTLLLYTDGVSEARDTTSVFYPLAQRLVAMPHDDPEALLERLVADVRCYVHGALADDAALVAVRWEA
ncbi:MAG: serine/threonine-protein phosphatase [Streptomycetaceae bacterium]|nr:serine/threonine-protein phosphatase [Streptomycetaceae bacterium]